MKSRTHKVLTFLLAVVMTCEMAGVNYILAYAQEAQPNEMSASAPSAATENNPAATQFIFDAASQTIISAETWGSRLVIPASIDVEGRRVPVLRITKNAFAWKSGRTKITDLVLPEGLQAIGDHAFDFNEIKSLTLPASLVSVGKSAFSHNDLSGTQDKAGLVIQPNSQLNTIGESAFDTSKLSGVDLTNATKLESIGNSAFAFNRIKELSLPESLKSIGNQAFASNLLEAVTVPDTITSYGTDVFIYNGRYVMVTTNSDLVSTNNVEGKFGSIKNPVSFWLEGVDAESEKILSTEEIKNDPFTQKPTDQLLFKGNTIDLPAPPIKRYKSNEHIRLTLDQAFLSSNTKEHPIRVKYRAVLGGPVFHGLDTLEVTLGTPQDQVNVLQGVTATDVDGQNITANIVADPTEINTSVLGKTIVKLSVTDEAGYTAHATRMVMVVTDPWDTDLGKGWTMRDFEFNKQGLTKLSKSGFEKIKTNKNLVLPSFNPLYNERGAHDNITVIPQRLFANQ